MLEVHFVEFIFGHGPVTLCAEIAKQKGINYSRVLSLAVILAPAFVEL